MSYLVLARKWRPRQFSELVGQAHVVRALGNALDADRVHHAFVFTGTRGVGKTTIARILAKSLNCERGVSSTPCGECGACRDIDAGRFVDLLEIDAASRTRVDDTRELLDNVIYAPARGRFKVYLIDEVHMLSTHSFNALLKTLEEPPPHVKFLLATTDPQKLPVTVLSRCLQFNLRRLDPDAIAQRLAEIASAESIQADAAALATIAHAADGSLRDALSLLDQAIAYGAGAVHEADVHAMLGTVDGDRVGGLLDALAAADATRLAAALAELAGMAVDFDHLLADIATALHRLQASAAFGGDADATLGCANELSAERIALWYAMAVRGRDELRFAPSARIGFEMCLLQMLAFAPSRSSAPGPGSPPRDSAGSERRGEDPGVAEARQTRGPASNPPSAPADLSRRADGPDDAPESAKAGANLFGESIAEQPADWNSRPLERIDATAPPVRAPAADQRSGANQDAAGQTSLDPTPPELGSALSAGEGAPDPVRSNPGHPEQSPTHAVAAVTPVRDPAHFCDLAGRIRVRGPVAELLRELRFVRATTGGFELALPSRLEHLCDDGAMHELAAALAGELGVVPRIQITIADVATQTLADCQAAANVARQTEAEAALHADAVVLQWLARPGFTATVGSAQPPPP